MQISKLAPGKTNAPTLFDYSRSDGAQIIPVLEELFELDLAPDITQILEQAAEHSGFDFLFELPGILFELPNHAAAVLECELSDGKLEHVFVLFGQDDGVITILHRNEIPDRAKQFYYSYTNILSKIGKISVSSQLH